MGERLKHMLTAPPVSLLVAMSAPIGLALLVLSFGSKGASPMRWPVIALCLRRVVAIGGAITLSSRTELALQGVFYAAAASMLVYGATMMGVLKLGHGEFQE